jgi:glycosyltransferase AglI
MKVAVLLSIYNDEATVEKVCVALSEQTFRKFDVLILDDGSTDRSVELASRYFKVYQGPGQGPDALRNFGIRLTDAEYILFTDGDCIVGSEWVEQMITSLDANYAGVAGKSIGIPFSENAICKTLVRRRGVAHIHQTPWHTEYYFPTCNVAYRRDVLETLGMFPTNLRYSGDIALSKLVGKRGYHCTINVNAILYHHLATNYHDLLRRYIRDGRGHRRLRWYNIIPMMLRIGLTPIHFFMVSLYHLSVLDVSQDDWYQEIIVTPLVDSLEYGLYYTGVLLEAFFPSD